MESDYLFWQAVYRALLAFAAAIKKYKLKESDQES